MDLTQIFTIFASVSIPVIVGFGAFYKMTQREIAVIREQTATLGQNHREDVKATDARWAKLFGRMDDKMSRMEEKWERLFEKYFEGKRQA